MTRSHGFGGISTRRLPPDAGDDRLRRALAIIYMPDETTYTGGKHYCPDGRGLIVGMPIAGDEFPLAGI